MSDKKTVTVGVPSMKYLGVSGERHGLEYRNTRYQTAEGRGLDCVNFATDLE